MGKIERLLVRYGGNVVQLAIAIWTLAFVAAFAGLLRPNWRWAIYLVCTVAVTAIVVQWTRTVRERYIREARLPAYLKRKLRETYPHLSQKDCELVERGLRQFFMACMRSRKQFVAMPSKAVDALWHDFILHTQAYKTWCHNALGFFLHHTPAEALGAKARNNDGLRRAWFWACKDEAINPKAPSRLPLLFALDAKMAIAGGFTYLPDCSNILPRTPQAAMAAAPTAAPALPMAATAAARMISVGPTVPAAAAATAPATAGAMGAVAAVVAAAVVGATKNAMTEN